MKGSRERLINMEEIEAAKRRCTDLINSINRLPESTNLTHSCRRTLLKLVHSDLTFLCSLPALHASLRFPSSPLSLLLIFVFSRLFTCFLFFFVFNFQSERWSLGSRCSNSSPSIRLWSFTCLQATSYSRLFFQICPCRYNLHSLQETSVDNCIR